MNKRFARLVTPMLVRPEFRAELLFLGTNEGRWPICRELLVPRGVCYCVGVGTNATLDIELARLDCEVHSFDPTPTAMAYARDERLSEQGVTFHAIGVWNGNKVLRFFTPSDPRDQVNYSIIDLHGTNNFVEAKCEALASIIERLGHTHISLLKLDVEGSWEVILDHMLTSNIRPVQLCVEFDSPTSLRKILAMKGRLRQAGYQVAWHEGENFLFVNEDAAKECKL